MSIPENKFLPFDSELYEKVKKLKTPASLLIEKIHDNPEIKELLKQDHFYVWDEMTVLYINDPTLFSFSLSPGRGKVMSLNDVDIEGLAQSYLKGAWIFG